MFLVKNAYENIHEGKKYNYLFSATQKLTRAYAASMFLIFLNHTQLDTLTHAHGRTPLDE